MKIFKLFTKELTKKLTALLLIAFAINAHAVRTTTYYHTDGLGSVVAASDESGNLLWRKSYAPYGEQIDGNTDNEPVSYTGKKHDDVTGLTYFGARYYDPRIGRFMATDPVHFMESNPVSFNRYAYVNNNPYKYVDPDGELPTPKTVYFFAKDVGSLLVEEIVYVAATVSGNPDVAQMAIEGMIEKRGNAAASTIDMLSPKSGVGKTVVNAVENATKKVNPNDLIPTQPLTKSRKQMKRLSNEIDEAGEITESLKYVERGGKKYLVDGHHRQALAKQKGMNEVPSQQVELPYKGYKTEKDLEFSQY